MKSFMYFLVLVLSVFGLRSVEATTTSEVFAKYPNKFFIESGSYLGDGIQNAIDAGFPEIYSIELNRHLYRKCCKRFKKQDFVHLVLGDSSKMLSIILKNIDAPATFWLDGHCSDGITVKGDSYTPILRELDAISQHSIKTHTIIIDDVRDFGTLYMDFINLDTIKQKILSINPNYEFVFEDGYVKGDVLVAIVRNVDQ